MQHLENEMDDLFRKAVERYPLKTCDSQWDDLSSKINSNKRWVLFLPILYREKKMPVSIFWGVVMLIPLAIISVSPLVYKKADTDKLLNTARSLNIITSKSSGNLNKSFDKFHIPVSSMLSHKIKESQFPSVTAASQELNYKYAQVEILHYKNRPLIEINRVQSGQPLIFDNRPVEIISTGLLHGLTLHQIAAPRFRGFYMGFLGGPIFSQVKDQRITKPGFDVGILMGYAFSKRLSLETGLLYTRQYFAVKSDYLLGILNMSGVKSLDGSRDAFSIPLKLKFNVITGSSGNFFLATGCSSFVGISDHIVITEYNSPVVPPSRINLGPPSYLPAYLNFSLGYEYKIGKSSNLRIEPYLEVPTNSSAGNSFKTHPSGHYMKVINSGIHIAISGFVHSLAK